ncbi:RagB/SusD family nutrient uptake outer membrane protein [Sinomicrobium weinanense]|uniref:RagB/SusD family nutrient uptake outer membrane protein n=1 Tax=Sinomicrobium weinanense TaxID=2842200 RepID=A0A926JP43_9FLAO|nr:RagB/SusD family nutrient uptake outer membrane protein [Sinomicrobium weinanense]MBC9794661.1 RagB/SusD family nutrient uptake outer membrane protein [Sinomicrobium weinanense]MBU3124146.1 RagB/SusD family nutrient uptake outer membrane protein [Sinomicrobium weinanense]
MKLNNKIIRILLLVSVLSLSACDVDRMPETQLSDDSFWASENDLKAASNYLYTFLPKLPVTTDVWSDDAIGTTPNNISDGSRITPATYEDYPINDYNDYNDPYKLIRAANNIIEKAPRVVKAGVDQQIIDWYIAEARFFRAWGYFSLVQRFGGVPLILKTLAEDAPELQEGKASREEVLNVIYEDLDFAAENLRGPDDLEPDTDYGRITNTAALAFKSRVALFEGTRAKYHSYGDPERHLTLAREAAKAVIESNKHDLFASYFDLYQYESEGRQNKENILVRKYGQSLGNSIVYHNAQRNLETGAANPTKFLADSYLMTDGLPISKSPMYEEPTNTEEVFKNRDPRMDATFFKKGDPYIQTIPVFNVPVLSFHKTGYANRRYANMEDWNNSRSYIDYAIIRYAEILLNYAEAVYELDGAISDSDLDISINRIRSRASMPDLTNTFVSTNGLDMLQEIRRERRVELALEGFRYWDIIRWKIAEDVLPQDILGNVFFDEFGTEVIPEVNEDNIIVVQKKSTRTFDPSRDYLWPFPTDELALNPNLEQNPGW